MAEDKIELIVIADEVLYGNIRDSNSHWIAARLVENGLRLRWIEVVGDNSSDLRHQLRHTRNRADVVILTGGLGPTHDDITRTVIARFFEDELILREDLLARLRDRFQKRGMEMPAAAAVMAEFPSHAEPISNSNGAAPGIHYLVDGRELFALPGVPVEMRGMMDEYVIPRLITRRKGHFGFRLIRTTGRGETNLAELIGDPTILEPVKLAFLPSIDHGVLVRIAVQANSDGDVSEKLDSAEKVIRDRIGEFIYAIGDVSLEEAIVSRLKECGLWLAVAESCTGGLVASRLVAISGASEVFDRGFVTYTNRAKVEMLGVDEATIYLSGAVSEETAKAMAYAARVKAGVDIAVSITGIAGPTGATSEKPVGLVYIGLADARGTEAHRYQFTGDRESNQRRSAHAALNLLWHRIKAVN